MPIVELLGVQFDMQLLLKLSLSMAAVLLVSWAYRFYSSRDARKLQLHSKDRPHRQSEELEELAEACQNISPNNDTNSGDQQRRSSITDDDSQMPDSGSGQSAEEDSHQTEIAENKPNMDQDISTEGEILSQREQAELNISNISFGSALNLPSARDGGMVSPTGRRSPCFLQRIEGSMGIGRVLRQDLECQGAYSSFLSKAEIKVEDASLVLEETGNQIVRGKIYDYYVESSSHSIRDSNPMVGQHQGKSSSSQMVEFGGHGSSLKDLPSTLTPIIMHDLVLPQRAVEEPSTLVSPKIKSPTGPILLRKESYLYAAEYSELPTPFPTSIPSHLNHTWASPCEKPISASSLITPTSDGKGLNVWEEPTLENLAGAPFLHLPAEKQESKDLEGLKGKLDLGNCIEVLGLAKKHCQSSLQQAVLQVMSDNYFQVLRDPSLFGRLMASEREQIQRQRMRGRRFVVVADMDPQDWVRNTGGQKIEIEQRRTSSTLYYFDDHKDAWHPLCPIPLEVISKACAMCTMDNYLFVAVGCQSTEREMIPSKQVFCFNPATSIWKEISPMNDARPHCKLVALQGYVYAIGGECLSTVERYNPQTDRWTFVAPLPNDTFAVAHRATVCNGEIFVCGGSLRYTLLRYNPKTNMWRASLVVGSKNRSTDMVAVKSFLYRFDINPMLGISVYRYHTVARLWYECSTKHLLHCPAFQCVVMQDTIYCISRQFTLRFMADEISPTFIADDLSVLSEAKGILFPFVLSLPDKKPLQTSV
ncbi:kelch domain-containing protein 7A [Lampris incognitus]|uniref:kelch domain-containing protein 7A n=1 Tax=Lampris incognitus TaxID=2546036 RepID=UPI0024B5DEDB|nr:kelch domain-containing protein 7A [Lampris incognitus]